MLFNVGDSTLIIISLMVSNKTFIAYLFFNSMFMAVIELYMYIKVHGCYHKAL